MCKCIIYDQSRHTGGAGRRKHGIQKRRPLSALRCDRKRQYQASRQYNKEETKCNVLHLIQPMVTMSLKKAVHSLSSFILYTTVAHKDFPWIEKIDHIPRNIVYSCGNRIWTCDLRVMSPTSFQTAPSRVNAYIIVLLSPKVNSICQSIRDYYDGDTPKEHPHS